MSFFALVLFYSRPVLSLPLSQLQWTSCTGQLLGAPCGRSPGVGGWVGFRPGLRTCTGGPSPDWPAGQSSWVKLWCGCCQPINSAAPSWYRWSPEVWSGRWWREAASEGSSVGWSCLEGSDTHVDQNKVIFYVGHNEMRFYVSQNEIRLLWNEILRRWERD